MEDFALSQGFPTISHVGPKGSSKIKAQTKLVVEPLAHKHFSGGVSVSNGLHLTPHKNSTPSVVDLINMLYRGWVDFK